MADQEDNAPEEIPGISPGSREYVSPDEALRRRAKVRSMILANVPREIARVALEKDGIVLSQAAFGRLWAEVLDQIKSEDDELGDARKAVWLAQVKEEAARASAAGQFSAAAKLRELQMKGEGHEQPRRIEVNVTGQVQSSVLTFLGMVSEERLREIVEDRAKRVGALPAKSLELPGD